MLVLLVPGVGMGGGGGDPAPATPSLPATGAGQ